jgi:hypothetical protein
LLRLLRSAALVAAAVTCCRLSCKSAALRFQVPFAARFATTLATFAPAGLCCRVLGDFLCCFTCRTQPSLRGSASRSLLWPSPQFSPLSAPRSCQLLSHNCYAVGPPRFSEGLWLKFSYCTCSAALCWSQLQ